MLTNALTKLIYGHITAKYKTKKGVKVQNRKGGRIVKSNRSSVSSSHDVISEVEEEENS